MSLTIVSYWVQVLPRVASTLTVLPSKQGNGSLGNRATLTPSPGPASSNGRPAGRGNGVAQTRENGLGPGPVQGPGPEGRLPAHRSARYAVNYRSGNKH